MARGVSLAMILVSIGAWNYMNECQACRPYAILLGLKENNAPLIIHVKALHKTFSKLKTLELACFSLPVYRVLCLSPVGTAAWWNKYFVRFFIAIA